ncbi:hypothetical protein H2200_008957 [Cladophialophora chaetospira]|uniref:Uncharacterized protein n=1 Tax=Cladophialophora chaetospira TaxID=386627 RepID=A0AA38X561_9EURO|nr:hypothetical protein H2200_008957 [Cladophialophora chaetospira]
MPGIFTAPVPTHWAQPAASSRSLTNKKRKKQKLEEDLAQKEELEVYGETNSKVTPSSNLEYSAVVTPEERRQRHVAGQPLNHEPPAFPFPHAADRSTGSRIAGQKRVSNIEEASETPRSLHMQHISTLTAVVHRTLLKKDFARASRALGLLFREEAVSEHAAVRNRGFMGIAAEVLLRHGSSHQAPSNLTRISTPSSFTHEGFEQAKRFYERLIVKHPYHKSWPNAVNAVDFYLAMFNLWIYVVHAEGATASDNDEEADEELDTTPKVRELEQANEIAQRLDTCMATVPYMDELEFIRLRAMVALWVADLHSDCASMAKKIDTQLHDSLVEQNSMSPSPQQQQVSQANEHLLEAGRSRDKARELLVKLEGQTT